MAETLRESLVSVLDQITDDYEVLVVDGGSTDGSIGILEALTDEYTNFRFLALDSDPDRNLGADRAISVKEAHGEYLLLHLDADDYYHEVIPDFVRVYHQIERQTDDELVMVGSHITMLRREHLLNLGGYRNLTAAEDIDLWRRALADDGTWHLWLDCEPFWEPLGYEKRLHDKYRRTLEMKTSEFQIGVTLWSYLRWTVSQTQPLKLPYGLFTTLLAYARAVRRESFSSPSAFSDKGRLSRAIDNRITIAELESDYGVTVDRSALSEDGRPYFQ